MTLQNRNSGLTNQSKLFFLSSGECSESIQRRAERSKRLSANYWASPTPEMERERLQLMLRGLNPLEFARKVLGFEPSEAQAKILEDAPFVKEITLNCSRQWGKSTVTAVLAATRLVMQPGV